MTDALDAAAEAMTYSPKPPMHSIYTGVAYRCDRIHQHVDFELHTTTILPQDRKVIEVIAQVLKDRSRNVRTIEVTGHVHWAEGKSKGWLAAARAAKVRSALLKLGVEPARVRVGKAEDPADAGSPPAAVTIESVEFDDPHCAG
ncbi:MAG: OmpA family protein [Deltaproteobacteria bacterium]|nr:OmpA family protein [Deltaproteobacteria bacterium]